MTAMQHIFNWANEMGLKGKKVFGLKFVDSENAMPSQPTRVFTQIECTQEERKHWEAVQKLQAKQYVYDMLREE